MDKTQSINTIRYNANMILSTSRVSTATLPNYRYLLNLGKRMDAISASIRSIGEDFENEPAANTVANSIHKAISNLIPIVPVLDFDHDGVGEDLNILVSKAIAILDDCDEGGLGSTLSDRFNTFIRMMEIHEELELEWLEMLAND
jgi:hypothetical protein